MTTPWAGAVAARDAPPRRSGATPLAYVALGVGIAGGAVGAFAGWQVLEAKSTVSSHCTTNRACDAEGVDAAARGSTFSVVSPVALAIGAVGLGLGGYLLLRKDGRSGRVALLPGVDGHAGSVAMRGGF